MSERQVDLICDLQYGSTGKGLIAGYLATRHDYDTVISANMPNAGHTFIDYHGAKMVHKVLPNGVVSRNCERIMIGPGAVFDPNQLCHELNKLLHLNYFITNPPTVYIHENAVVLDERHRNAEDHMAITIGSTAQGSSAAMIEKIRRNPNRQVIARDLKELIPEDFDCVKIRVVSPQEYRFHIAVSQRILVEGAQGFSLGINERFYPFCTSRDCTPARICADTAVPIQAVTRVIGTCRTFPIRVGGNSGGCYEDQKETTWEALGLEPETTTVTGRVRRVFTWSPQQFADAMIACQPDEIFVNFMNYLKTENEVNWLRNHIRAAGGHIGWEGWGARVQDVDRKDV